MSEQIREQVSAFLDGELPKSETELLLKRLTRDAELRQSFGLYALIGESLRGASRVPLSRDFAGRVNRAIDGEPVAPHWPAARAAHPRWWRPLAGVAVAGGVMAVAIVALQQRAVAPGVRAALPVTAQNVPMVKPTEAISYTVPEPASEVPAVLPAARLTSYVFAHSRYSSGLGQNNVLSALLSDPDEQPPPAAAPAVNVSAATPRLRPTVREVPGQPPQQDARIAP
jgi:negative regulator of sigma E activity